MGKQNSLNQEIKKRSGYFSSACWQLCNLSEHRWTHAAWPGAWLCCSAKPGWAPLCKDTWQRGLAGSKNHDRGLAGASGFSGIACVSTWSPGEVAVPQPVLLAARSLFVFPEWINTNPKGLNVALASSASPRMHSDCVSLLENRNQFALKHGCDM